MLPVVQSQKPPTVFTPGKKKRINLVAVCLNIFLPWFLFCSIFAIMSFSFHYQSPGAAWGCVGGGLLVVLASGLMAVRAKTKAERDPSWYLFSTLALFLAVVLAAVAGDMNFWSNMQPFYDIENLNTYPSVNPSIETGQRLMDAGRVYFADGTRLDTAHSMGFKNLDLYCVAPIVNGAGSIESYDFWAVGLNCCNGVSSDFRCGEFNNPHARAGLRLMRDDQRPFFRLAVQQAAAAHKLKSTHPLFFHWLQDPVAEMNSFRDAGFKYYLLGIFSHFAFNLFMTTVAVIGFSRIGKI